jgi:hypothetical protein
VHRMKCEVRGLIFREFFFSFIFSDVPLLESFQISSMLRIHISRHTSFFNTMSEYFEYIPKKEILGYKLKSDPKELSEG